MLYGSPDLKATLVVLNLNTHVTLWADPATVCVARHSNSATSGDERATASESADAALAFGGGLGDERRRVSNVF